jgi:hypothetical protein
MMTLMRIFLLVLLVVAGARVTFAQTDATKTGAPSEPTVTVSISDKGVRFAAMGSIGQMRLEVFNANGDSLYNSDFQIGNMRDWALQDKLGQPVADGSYLCVITLRDLSGRLGIKQGTVLVQDGHASLRLSEGQQVGTIEPDKSLAPVSAGNAPAVTLTAHDGTDGQLVSTRGGLSFRLGDFFAGLDRESMRLTPEGNLGVGIIHPLVRLDVDGLVRASQGIVFPDGSIQYSAATKTFGPKSSLPDASFQSLQSKSGKKSSGGQEHIDVAGTGTAGRITKWTDGSGTLGDTQVSESNGAVVVGNASFTGNVQIFGPAIADVFAGMGPDVINGPAFNYGYSGSSFGRGSGFFNVRPDASAVAPNPSLRFMTVNVQRMIIDNLGNVGIGTTNPQAKLDVAGDIQVSGNIAAKYQQDIAEWVPANQKLEGGTVVSLDVTRNNTVAPSSRAYDTHIAGVVSAQPGLTLGEGGEGKVLVATTGRVKVKVDATRHPIKIGDLLVASGESGTAMKSQPIRVGRRLIHRPGTIIGKALEPLAKGRGEILVLLSLQ